VSRAQQPQQTGVLFIIRQQVQPAFFMVAQQSQQDWIISPQALSPDVQVIVQPSLVMSHLHMPIVRLQQHTMTPFIMQQTEHMPPCSVMHRFCIMLLAVASSQTQVIFMPPCTFSNLKVQRGTIIQDDGIVMGPVIPAGVIPCAGMPIPVRSIIIPVIDHAPFHVCRATHADN
jgi:hypothetical protein